MKGSKNMPFDVYYPNLTRTNSKFLISDLLSLQIRRGSYTIYDQSISSKREDAFGFTADVILALTNGSPGISSSSFLYSIIF